MQIHEDFINAISYPILVFLNKEFNDRDISIDDQLANEIQMKIQESIRDGVVDIANQVDDLEALVIGALRSPALVDGTSPRTPKNIALDALAIALKCREGITEFVREARNDSANNPLMD